MSVCYRTKLIIGIKVNDILEEINANGIDINMFIEEMYSCDVIINTNDYNDEDDYSNYIIGECLTSLKDGESKEIMTFENELPKIFLNIMSNTENSRYRTFVKDILSKYIMKHYVALCVS